MLGEVSSRACSGALARSAGMAQSWGLRTLRGNNVIALRCENNARLRHETARRNANECQASQRSLHNAPIFRLLLKVAVNGTHQCDFHNFCGAFAPQQMLDAKANALRQRCSELPLPTRFAESFETTRCPRRARLLRRARNDLQTYLASVGRRSSSSLS